MLSVNAPKGAITPKTPMKDLQYFKELKKGYWTKKTMHKGQKWTGPEQVIQPLRCASRMRLNQHKPLPKTRNSLGQRSTFMWNLISCSVAVPNDEKWSKYSLLSR